jgi:hypothetical protein
MSLKCEKKECFPKSKQVREDGKHINTENKYLIVKQVPCPKKDEEKRVMNYTPSR